MGLTRSSTGGSCNDRNLLISNTANYDILVALAGNPNVGKSTVFNELTGMHQHTGNWPGKTVSGAEGYFNYKNKRILLTDIPGCYSLIAHSAEEEVARDFICFGGSDKTVVVCDATCLERNLALVLQTIEINGSCIVCVNLADEAEAHNIKIDTEVLERELGVPVVLTAARNRIGLEDLCDKIIADNIYSERKITYPDYIENIIRIMTPHLTTLCEKHHLSTRWLALRLAENNPATNRILNAKLDGLFENINIRDALRQSKEYLEVNGITRRQLTDDIASSALQDACITARKAVTRGDDPKERIIQKTDSILTGKYTAFPLMLLMLMLIFYITVSGANIPSEFLHKLFFTLENKLYTFFIEIGTPQVICEALFHGVFRTLSWVVSVMLPPMAIFFPLFTLLEDSGMLPRIAFNLDRAFQGCKSCGKQSLTMCMGFGCNAAGVVGCRIIDSPRERLIATLTNSFVPCNGRFPGMISMIAMFFCFSSTFISDLLSALILTGFIILGVFITLICSRALSLTVLKGVPSSFTLELPPYRRPQFAKVLVRSILDRTLFVLSRAIAVAAPAGLIIWLLANINIGENTLLHILTASLDETGRFFGLDGVILTAFILGFPANEIVIPIMLMAYMANGTLTDITDLNFIRSLLIDNGWTTLTALNFILFSLMHFPCSTTMLTIRKETDSIKWTLFAFFLPTAVGLIFCLLTTTIARLFG